MDPGTECVALYRKSTTGSLPAILSVWLPEVEVGDDGTCVGGEKEQMQTIFYTNTNNILW